MMSPIMVDLPEPDSPTTAIFSFFSILRFRPLNIHCFGLDGYLNQTFLNSIVWHPLGSYYSLSFSYGSIMVGVLKMVVILVAACFAFATSGAKVKAPEAAKVPKIITKTVIKILRSSRYS